jgi:arginase
MNTKQPLAVIGVPLDLGAGRRGVDMGPSALRLAGLKKELAALGCDVSDFGNLVVTEAESIREPGAANAHYLKEISRACERLAGLVILALAQGLKPVIVGGDHSISAGSVAGVSSHFKSKGQNIGLIWMDAHADMNTPQSTPSGNVHGMPLACTTGFGPPELVQLMEFAPKVNPANVALIGIRDVDLEERRNVRDIGVKAYTMRDIDERGLRAVMEEAIGHVTKDTTGFHLSLDMDFLDPQYAPGVGTAVPGGATYREAHLAMEMLSDTGKMLSMDVVEVNPVIDEANRTAKLAVELVLSAMGRKIL